MKVRVLGCGCAGGVPLIGNVWGKCNPQNPKNRRLRSSLFIDGGHEGEKILIDTSPDMRQQLLDAQISDLSAILYTHAHADHTHGIDNVRSVNWLTGKPMPIYADQMTMSELQSLFPYVFQTPPQTNRFTLPSVEPHLISDDSSLSFGSLRVTTFHQRHGKGQSRGYRINDFGYSTDVDFLDDYAFEKLAGIKVWILGAIRVQPHHSHAHIDLALEWIDRVKPSRVILTHMDHSVDYDTISVSLPSQVELAYDGMEIEI